MTTLLKHPDPGLVTAHTTSQTLATLLHPRRDAPSIRSLLSFCGDKAIKGKLAESSLCRALNLPGAMDLRV